MLVCNCKDKLMRWVEVLILLIGGWYDVLMLKFFCSDKFEVEFEIFINLCVDVIDMWLIRWFEMWRNVK